MRKILVLLTVILITAFPVLADINQKANINGGGGIVVNVKQEAWNYGSGDINQKVNVRVAGNLQMSDMNTLVNLDSDYDGNITNNLNGINLIKIDLSQYGNNTGSGDLGQGVDVTVEGNLQILDQGAVVV